jgi:hypothetical protein
VDYIQIRNSSVFRTEHSKFSLILHEDEGTIIIQNVIFQRLYKKCSIRRLIKFVKVNQIITVQPLVLFSVSSLTVFYTCVGELRYFSLISSYFDLRGMR